MNTVVHQLIARDLLEQRPHPTHRKVIVLSLSPKGRQLLDQATPAVRAIEQAAVGGLPTSHTQVITRWLDTVTTKFTSDEPSP